MRRSDKSFLTSWYFEIDRRLLWCVVALTFIGFLMMITAGSAAAERIGQPWHFFFLKMLPFYGLGLLMLFGASMLSKKSVLILSAVDVAICFALLLVSFVAPHSIKGSARWVQLPLIGGVMPSDLMKPGFIIMTALFLSKMQGFWRREWFYYLIPFAVAFGIIFQHPDLGTSILYFAVFASMIFLAGLPWLWVGALGVAGIGIGGVAYILMPHVRARLAGGDGYQIKQSIQSIQHGGLLGSGDDAFVKQSLPDAHTDFVFSALCEDWGAIVGIVLIGVLLYVIKRLADSALLAREKFVFYAAGGTAALFGAQVCINLMASLNIGFIKGMTLPFVSYGGSSFVAFCLLFGMLLAVVREDKWK